MPTISLSGYLQVSPVDLKAVRRALPEHLQKTRAEPGCLRFDVWEDSERPGHFHVMEEFLDQAAFDGHQARTRASAWAAVSQHATRHYNVRQNRS